MTHTHNYDSAELYLEAIGTLTPVMLACRCGALAIVGDGPAEVLIEQEEREAA